MKRDGWVRPSFFDKRMGRCARMLKRSCGRLWPSLERRSPLTKNSTTFSKSCFPPKSRLKKTSPCPLRPWIRRSSKPNGVRAGRCCAAGISLWIFMPRRSSSKPSPKRCRRTTGNCPARVRLWRRPWPKTRRPGTPSGKVFLHHEWNPWEEWVETEGVDLPALVYVARSCLRPSVEWTAEELLKTAFPDGIWKEGYCPVCGSLPALITLQGQGNRQAHCSWCGTSWRLARFQCPVCDNRRHETLGYLYAEEEPRYRIDYCTECRHYFKTVDTRELLWPIWVPLEEWTTLHLDLVAQRAQWKTPPSPAPAVYEADPPAVPS